MYCLPLLLLGMSLFHGVKLQGEMGVQHTMNELGENVQTLRNHATSTDWPEKKILAYYNTGDLSTLYTEGVDYILFAFAFVDEDGNIYLDPDNQKKLTNALPVLDKLKEERPDLKTLISVGGYRQSKTFPIVAMNPIKRLRFTVTAAEFMDKYDFDGIDISWLFSKCSDAEYYADLVNDMRLENPDKILTVSVSRRPTRMVCIDYTLINQAVDYFNLLTYEYYGAYWSSITGFNTPLYHDRGEPCYFDVDASTRVFLGLKGIDKNKVILGLAFYGQQFSQTDGLYKPFVKGDDSYRIDYKDISDIDSAIYDPSAGAVHIYKKSKRQLTTFDNVQSIGVKCNYFIEQKVAGAVIWELGGDRNGELLAKAVSTLKNQG